MAGRRLEDLNLSDAPVPGTFYPAWELLIWRSLNLDVDDDPTFARFCWWAGTSGCTLAT